MLAVFVLVFIRYKVFLSFFNLLHAFLQRKRVVVPAALKIVRLKPTRKVGALSAFVSRNSPPPLRT